MARFTGAPGGEGIPGPQGPQGPQGETGADADTGNFVFYSDPNQIATSGDASIVVESVPGSLSLSAYDGVVLQYSTAVEDNGVFIQDSSDPNNRVATIGDVASYAPETVSFTVNGGTLGTQPTFDGDPLFTGSYIKTGDLVAVEINVEMTNITNFGTGQYFLDIPYPTKQDISFSGVLHDVSANNYYMMTGIAEAGGDRVLLYYSGSNGQLEPFQQGSPKTLQTVDHFSLHGTYIDDAN